MTPHEIVALRCPSCGGGASQPSREMPFGAEFRCDHCGVTSVLIIDRALVPLSTLQQQGEKVCTSCGRIALREARFCQEGHVLVRQCEFCSREFAVDHQRCDFCGKLQPNLKANERIVKSPIVGTFYRAPELSSPPFVQIGTIVKNGQVLCIIEAMALMNEIDCEYDGEVVAIYVENAKPVEYGEWLFKIKVA